MMLADELKNRGLIEHASAEPERIFSVPRTVYLGIDPTADSLQIGNLAVILLMKRLGDAGHKLVFLVGGATGMIGDPKEVGERSLLDEKTVAQNVKAIKRQLKSLLGAVRFSLVDNMDWFSGMRLIPFLRDVGKHFTVNELAKRDVIKRRLENPDDSISFTEFSYALLQGYDFYRLHERYGCDLEVGASDQWTNILSGVDLIRKRAGAEAFAFTMPLITDASGKKFGKSEGNAVWLDPKKTSPFQFYQFWLRLPDERVDTYLKAYTFLPLAEIDALMELHRRNPGERQAQETLARLTTEIVHGPAATAAAVAATDALFGETPFDLLSRDARAVALAEAPFVPVPMRAVREGYPLADLLIAGGLAPSKSEARRLIEGKAVSVHGMTIESADQKLFAGDFHDGYALIRKGKQGVLLAVLK